MDQKNVLEILKKFDESKAVSLTYKVGDAELSLKKEGAFVAKGAPVTVSQAAPVIAASPVAPSASPASAPASESTSPKATDANLIEVKSPIVGTFYRQPSPDAPPFVEVGTKVSKGSALCILEAMKMMNTLESEFDGVIEKVLVDSGDLVEFEQPLFLIRV